MASVEKLVATCDLCGRNATNPSGWYRATLTLENLERATSKKLMPLERQEKGLWREFDACGICVAEGQIRTIEGGRAVVSFRNLWKAFCRLFGGR